MSAPNSSNSAGSSSSISRRSVALSRKWYPHRWHTRRFFSQSLLTSNSLQFGHLTAMFPGNRRVTASTEAPFWLAIVSAGFDSSFTEHPLSPPSPRHPPWMTHPTYPCQHDHTRGSKPDVWSPYSIMAYKGVASQQAHAVLLARAEQRVDKLIGVKGRDIAHAFARANEFERQT